MELDHGWCRSSYLLDLAGMVVERCTDTPGSGPHPAPVDQLARRALPGGAGADRWA